MTDGRVVQLTVHNFEAFVGRRSVNHDRQCRRERLCGQMHMMTDQPPAGRPGPGPDVPPTPRPPLKNTDTEKRCSDVV